jgi:hypothetical protein
MLGRLPEFFWPFSAHFWEISRICEAISRVRTKFRILGGQIPDPDKNQTFWGNFCPDIKVKKWAKMDLAYIGIFRGPGTPPNRPTDHMRSFGIIALVCVAVLLGTNAQSSTPGCYACPPTDEGGFPVGNTDTLSSVLIRLSLAMISSARTTSSVTTLLFPSGC